MLDKMKEKLATAITLDGEAVTSPKPSKKATSNLGGGSNNGKNFIIIKFKLILGSEKILFTLKGQKAKTLKYLVDAGVCGCTALDISKTFALRLSEYVRALRRDKLAGGHNLEIIMIKEQNPVGWHGRYILASKVELVEIL